MQAALKKGVIMNNYIIYTDSASDISPALLEKWGVKCINLTFVLDGEERIYSENEIPIKDFYNLMRSGTVAKTSAINSEAFKAAFESELSQGRDILYLGFSSGLSTTCGCARIAADELMEKYPERRVRVVDTLSASSGFGLLVYLTVEQKNKGASLEQAAQYAIDKVPSICHWFTVDNLTYLKRGGRISPTVAFVGGLLGIKPVLHVDNEGHLVNFSKARGRKAALKALADKYTDLAVKPSEGTVFISQADCMEDAKELAKILKSRHKITVAGIMDIGAVIGAHAGPGTIALFFVGKER